VASERDLPGSPPHRRPLAQRVLRAAAIAVGSLLLVAALAIAAMVRRDIPLEALLPEYGAPPSKFVEISLRLTPAPSARHSASRSPTTRVSVAVPARRSSRFLRHAASNVAPPDLRCPSKGPGAAGVWD
jgi:hypothetical protein